MGHRRIDIHTHILPPEIPRFEKKFGYGDFVHLEACDCGANMMKSDGSFFRKVQENCIDPDVRIKDMDETSVSVQVLSTVPIMFSYFTKPKDGLYVAQFLNDHIAGIVNKYPHRFQGLGTLPMQAPDMAIKELIRCKKELGLVGVQIATHINEWNLSAPELYPIFEAAQDLDMSIFVHPWEMMGQGRMPEYWLPWLVGMPAEASLAICSLIFSGVFEKLPNLRFAFAHGGGSFPGTVGRVQHGYDVRPDLCAKDNKFDPRKYCGHFFVDSLVHDPKMLSHIVELFGSDKVALGSDYPFPLGEHNPGALIEGMENFNEELKQQLLWGNALKWMNRTEQQVFGEK